MSSSSAATRSTLQEVAQVRRSRLLSHGFAVILAIRTSLARSEFRDSLAPHGFCCLEINISCDCETDERKKRATIARLC